MEPEPEHQDQDDDVTKINYITTKCETFDDLLKVDIDEFHKNLEVRRKVHGKADYLVKNSLKQYHTILERALSNMAELFEEILEECDLELPLSPTLLPPENPDSDDPTNSDGLLITTTPNKVTFVQEENNNVVDIVEKCNMSQEEFKENPLLNENETNKVTFGQENNTVEVDTFGENSNISREYPILNENDMEVVDNEIPSCSKSTGKDQDKSDVFRILGFETGMIMRPTMSANSIEENQNHGENSVNLLSERKPEVVLVGAIHRRKKKVKHLPPPPLITRPLQQQQQQQHQQQQHLANINNLQNVMNLSFGDKSDEIISQFCSPRPRSPNCEPSGPPGPTLVHRKPKLEPPPLISR